MCTNYLAHMYDIALLERPVFVMLTMKFCGSRSAWIRIMKSNPDQHQSKKSGPELHHFDQRPNSWSLTGGIKLTVAKG
jgi:hypothetical protein